MDADATRRVLDQLEIRELVARYNYAIDEGRPDEWVATFVPDGTFESSALGTHTGPEALHAFATGYLADVTGRHCTSDFVIDVDGDEARSRCYLIAINNAGPRQSP
jgi:SnoaL-like domain